MVKKSNKPSHLKDLLLLFAAPIGITMIALAAVYIPRLLANPKYDFIYSICGYYSCEYSVDDAGFVVQHKDDNDYQYRDNRETLRYYSAKDNSTRVLSFSESKAYQLDTSPKSPDGYVLTKQENSAQLLIFSNYDTYWYLKNGAKIRKVDLSNDGAGYYSQNINFLGWVKQ